MATNLECKTITVANTPNNFTETVTCVIGTNPVDYGDFDQIQAGEVYKKTEIDAIDVWVSCTGTIGDTKEVVLCSNL